MKTPLPVTLKPRKMPIQARAAATVDAIFLATIQVLLAERRQRLTTTRVAQRAGVSVGTMYQYFPNKHALLYAVVDQHLTEFVEVFEAACLTHRNASIASMTEGIVNAFLDTKIRAPDTTQALFKIAGELDTDQLRLATTERLQAACATLLGSAADASFDNLPDIAFTLLTAMHGTTSAVFEFGADPRRVHLLRLQLLALCRGYLYTSTIERKRDLKHAGSHGAAVAQRIGYRLV